MPGDICFIAWVRRHDFLEITFQDSDAIVEGQFIGLPVDEDFEPELTDERVTVWVDSLMKVF